MISTEEESSYSALSTPIQFKEQKPLERKSKEIVKLLISLFYKYEGHWDEENFKDLVL
jgi:hypothetical protein